MSWNIPEFKPEPRTSFCSNIKLNFLFRKTCSSFIFYSGTPDKGWYELINKNKLINFTLNFEKYRQVVPNVRMY